MDYNKFVEDILFDSQILQYIEEIVRQRLVKSPNELPLSSITAVIDQSLDELEMTKIISETLQSLKLPKNIKSKIIRPVNELLPNFSDTEPSQTHQNSRRITKGRLVSQKSNGSTDASAKVSLTNQFINAKVDLNDTILIDKFPEFSMDTASSNTASIDQQKKFSVHQQSNNVNNVTDVSALTDDRDDSQENEICNQSSPSTSQTLFQDRSSTNVVDSKEENKVMKNTTNSLLSQGFALSAAKDDSDVYDYSQDDFDDGTLSPVSTSPSNQHKSTSRLLAKEDEEDEEDDRPRKIQFAENVVSEVYLTRYKYDPEEVDELFFGTLDSKTFQTEYEYECNKAEDLGLDWMSYMDQRSEQDRLAMESEVADMFAAEGKDGEDQADKYLSQYDDEGDDGF